MSSENAAHKDVQVPHCFDVLIVGGGMVGASLACALGQADMDVALIEATPPEAEITPSYDDRPIALSYGSSRILDTLGVWPDMAGFATPIRGIHVSDRGGFGVTRMGAREHGVPALGYVVAARVIGDALEGVLGRFNRVRVFQPAVMESLSFDSKSLRVGVGDAVSGQRFLEASLIVAADGGRSEVREQVGIETQVFDYAQVAITANVSPIRPHQGVAYERFTADGPLALLPLAKNRCGLVWTVPRGAEEGMMALNDADFLGKLTERFGSRLGGFSRVGQRGCYPLALIRAREQVRERVAIIGNAAHTLHPIAGQGFNLGLRDVATLAEIVVDAARAGADFGSLSNLEAYASRRRQDQRSVTAFTDSLVRVFSNGMLPLAVARGLGLAALDLSPALKGKLVRHAMGLAGTQPRLARGMSL